MKIINKLITLCIKHKKRKEKKKDFFGEDRYIYIFFLRIKKFIASRRSSQYEEKKN
jgi:hypothetical protein